MNLTAKSRLLKYIHFRLPRIFWFNQISFELYNLRFLCSLMGCISQQKLENPVGSWLMHYTLSRQLRFLCFRVFSFKQPDGGTTENCLILGKEAGSLGVFDRRCDHYGTGVVCEYIPQWSLKVVPEPTTTPEPTVTEAQNPCGSWDNHGESCYKLILKDDLDFHEALVECANENAYLVQVNSKGELVRLFYEADLKKSITVVYTCLQVYKLMI